MTKSPEQIYQEDVGQWWESLTPLLRSYILGSLNQSLIAACGNAAWTDIPFKVQTIITTRVGALTYCFGQSNPPTVPPKLEAVFSGKEINKETNCVH